MQHPPASICGHVLAIDNDLAVMDQFVVVGAHNESVEVRVDAALLLWNNTVAVKTCIVVYWTEEAVFCEMLDGFLVDEFLFSWHTI